MFALPRHPYAPPYSGYSPYEQLLIEQELQRRQRAEACRRRQLEMEELNRRRQHEQALRQAELERRRQMTISAERERRRSMIGGGMEELLGMLYGGRPMPSSFCNRRSPAPRHEASPQPSVRPVGADPHTEESISVTQDVNLSAEVTEHATSAPTLANLESDLQNAEDTETQDVQTSASHSAVAGILGMFASLQSDFTFPIQLDFLPSSSSESPKLAYTTNNVPLHQYEHVLTGLLTRLDAVESYGDGRVRKERKAAVQEIEKELAGLDKRKAEEWMRQNASAGVVESRQEGIMDSEDETVAMGVDAATVPLPDDCEDERKMEETPRLSAPASPAIGSLLYHTSDFCDTNEEHQVETKGALPESSVDAPLLPSPGHTGNMQTSEVMPTEGSLGPASISDESDSELDDYIDVEADIMSGTEMDADSELAEEAEVRGLVAMDEWEMDF
ncbi:BAG domain protein [Ceratobasidium sp. AG-Ba]|nr:BAG domain protein [Ceratobasidium sp. AG-Ba]